MKGVAGVEGTPIIGLDAWEHVYYLKCQNPDQAILKHFECG